MNEIKKKKRMTSKNQLGEIVPFVHKLNEFFYYFLSADLKRRYEFRRTKHLQVEVDDCLHSVHFPPDFRIS